MVCVLLCAGWWCKGFAITYGLYTDAISRWQQVSLCCAGCGCSRTVWAFQWPIVHLPHQGLIVMYQLDNGEQRERKKGSFSVYRHNCTITWKKHESSAVYFYCDLCDMFCCACFCVIATFADVSSLNVCEVQVQDSLPGGKIIVLKFTGIKDNQELVHFCMWKKCELKCAM